jgi:cytochrome c-type biogenesis protein
MRSPLVEVSYLAAALAGLVSFLSPCVLPLVPGYLCYVAGTSLDRLSDGTADAEALNRRVMITSTGFVLGFGTIFVGLGAAATVLNELLRQYSGCCDYPFWLAVYGFVPHRLFAT